MNALRDSTESLASNATWLPTTPTSSRQQCQVPQAVSKSPARGPVDSSMIAIAEHCPSALWRASWGVSQFDLAACVYEGDISRVWRAVDRRSGITLALKAYQRSAMSSRERHQVAREIWLHAQLHHPSVIAMYAAWKDADTIYLALEWADEGNVFAFVASRGGRLDERTAVVMVLEPMLSALAYVHDMGIIHRDLKPENVLMCSRNLCVKLADFGLSIHSHYEVANTRLGTLDYVAPEVLDCPAKDSPRDRSAQSPCAAQYSGRGQYSSPSMHIGQVQYSSQADCWSVGVLAYEMLLGRPPFEARNPLETLRLIRDAAPDLPSGEVSASAASFIRAALTRDPTQRPTSQQLLQHPWIKAHSQLDREATSGSGGTTPQPRDVLSRLRRSIRWSTDGTDGVSPRTASELQRGSSNLQRDISELQLGGGELQHGGSVRWSTDGMDGVSPRRASELLQRGSSELQRGGSGLQHSRGEVAGVDDEAMALVHGDGQQQEMRQQRLQQQWQQQQQMPVSPRIESPRAHPFVPLRSPLGGGRTTAAGSWTRHPPTTSTAGCESPRAAMTPWRDEAAAHLPSSSALQQHHHHRRHVQESWQAVPPACASPTLHNSCSRRHSGGSSREVTARRNAPVGDHGGDDIQRGRWERAPGESGGWSWHGSSGGIGSDGGAGPGGGFSTVLLQLPMQRFELRQDEGPVEQKAAAAHVTAAVAAAPISAAAPVAATAAPVAVAAAAAAAGRRHSWTPECGHQEASVAGEASFQDLLGQNRPLKECAAATVAVAHVTVLAGACRL